MEVGKDKRSAVVIDEISSFRKIELQICRSTVLVNNKKATDVQQLLKVLN